MYPKIKLSDIYNNKLRKLFNPIINTIQNKINNKKKEAKVSVFLFLTVIRILSFEWQGAYFYFFCCVC